jgi:OOP family OmpA-OmpF porin
MMWPQVVTPLLAAALGIVINLLTDRFSWPLVAGLALLLGIQIMIEIRAARKRREESTQEPGHVWSLPALLREPRLWTAGAGALAAVAVILGFGWVRAAVNDGNPSATRAPLAELWGDPAPQCPEPPNGNYAIAVGAHANSPHSAIPAEMVTSMIGREKKAQNLSIVSIDGTPGVIMRSAVGQELDRVRRPENRDRVVDSFLVKVRGTVAAMRAGSAETAPLAALSLTAREVGPGGAVVMVDSGLQTVDPIDFRQGFLTASPAEISKWLKDNRLLPDLKGRTVLLAGLGDTAPPQPPLNDALRSDLVAIWQQIARDSGAACVSTVTAPALGAAPAGLPQVSVVPLPQTPSLRLSCSPSSFTTSSTIGFRGDSTTFRDPAAASATLRTLAEDIRAGNRRVILTGTAANYGTRTTQLSLSRARAEAVNDELLRLGVPADLITVKAAGSDFSGFVDDRDRAGNLDPVRVGENRSVILQLDC